MFQRAVLLLLGACIAFNPQVVAFEFNPLESLLEGEDVLPEQVSFECKNCLVSFDMSAGPMGTEVLGIGAAVGGSAINPLASLNGGFFAYSLGWMVEDESMKQLYNTVKNNIAEAFKVVVDAVVDTSLDDLHGFVEEIPQYASGCTLSARKLGLAKTTKAGDASVSVIHLLKNLLKASATKTNTDNKTKTSTDNRIRGEILHKVIGVLPYLNDLILNIHFHHLELGEKRVTKDPTTCKSRYQELNTTYGKLFELNKETIFSMGDWIFDECTTIVYRDYVANARKTIFREK